MRGPKATTASSARQLLRSLPMPASGIDRCLSTLSRTSVVWHGIVTWAWLSLCHLSKPALYAIHYLAGIVLFCQIACCAVSDKKGSWDAILKLHRWCGHTWVCSVYVGLLYCIETVDNDLDQLLVLFHQGEVSYHAAKGHTACWYTATERSWCPIAGRGGHFSVYAVHMPICMLTLLQR